MRCARKNAAVFAALLGGLLGGLVGGLAGCAAERSPTESSVESVPPVGVAAKPLPQPEDVAPRRSVLLGIPAGSHRSFFPGKDEPDLVDVAAFALEEHAVTNAQFLLFVRANPAWCRSAAKPLFVDTNYLRHWRSDFGFPDGLAESPVVNVSWFAARAYARWIGRRLPTLQEWEYVAAASETSTTGSKDPGFNQRILQWYGKSAAELREPVKSTFRNVHGVYDMHGLVWEWVENFNTALVTGESRGDTGLDRTLFCGAGSIGSANPEDYASFMRFAFRSSMKAAYTTKNLGFRCAADGAR